MTCAQTYTYAQLEQLWINAGGPASVAPVAAAIAEAESGGCVNAAYPGTTVPVGEGSTTDATGLWQILGLPSGNFTAADLTSATGNAKMAVAKYQQAGNSFTPWQTYTSGAYAAFISNSTTPDRNVPAGTSVADATGASATASTASYAAGTCAMPVSLPVVGSFCLLSKSQARGVLGGALMVAGFVPAVLGLLLLAAAGFSASGAGRQAAAAVGTVRKVPFVP